MSNKADPRVLTKLSAYDRQVHEHRGGIEAGKRMETRLKGELNESAAEVSVIRERSEKLKKENRKLEAEADDMRSQAKRHGGRLNEITDSRDWRALNEEVRYLQRQAERKDESGLENLEVLEGIEAELKESEEEFSALREKINNKLALIEAEREEHGKGLVTAEESRTKFVATLEDKITLQYYERRSKRMDMPVVWMRLGSCSHCHHGLTPQGRIEVENAKRLVVCEGCGRVVVRSDEALEGNSTGKA